MGQAGGQRQQGFAGASGAGQGDKVNLRVHQQVDGKVLLAVARIDAPHRIFGMGEVLQGFEGGGFAPHLGDPGVHAGLAGGLKVNELVDVQTRHDGAAHPVEGVAGALPAFNVFGVLDPKIFTQAQCA